MGQLLGVGDFSLVETTQRHPLGYEVTIPGNAATPPKTYVYVQFGAATVIGNACKGTNDSQPYNGVIQTAASGGANQIIRGVSVGTGVNGSFGWLQKKGQTPATTMLESATVAPGDALQSSDTTAGRFDIATAAALVNASAVCLTDGGSNAGIVDLDCP